MTNNPNPTAARQDVGRRATDPDNMSETEAAVSMLLGWPMFVRDLLAPTASDEEYAQGIAAVADFVDRQKAALLASASHGERM